MDITLANVVRNEDSRDSTIRVKSGSSNPTKAPMITISDSITSVYCPGSIA